MEPITYDLSTLIELTRLSPTELNWSTIANEITKYLHEGRDVTVKYGPTEIKYTLADAMYITDKRLQLDLNPKQASPQTEIKHEIDPFGCHC